MLKKFSLALVICGVIFPAVANAQVEIAGNVNKKTGSTTVDCDFSFIREGNQIKFNQNIKVTKSGISGVGKGVCRVWAEDSSGGVTFSKELGDTVGAVVSTGTASKRDSQNGFIKNSTFDSRFDAVYIIVDASDSNLSHEIEKFIKDEIDKVKKGKLSEVVAVNAALDLGGAIIKRVK